MLINVLEHSVSLRPSLNKDQIKNIKFMNFLDLK